MVFPAEAVPDGNVFAPHHLTYALIALLWAGTYAWDRFTDREPWAVTAGAGAALFAFLFVWPLYPVTGALLTLAGLGAASGGLLRWRSYWTRPVFWLGIVLVALAWDDWLSHALGIWTPADAVWNVYIVGALP